MKPMSLLIFVLLLAGLGYRLQTKMTTPREQIQPSHAGWIEDNSSSQTVDCDAFPAMAMAMLQGMPLSRKSTMFVGALSASEHAYELVLKMPPTAIPRTGGGNLGNGTGAFEDKLKKACVGFGIVPASSIVRAVQLGLAQLHSMGCGKPGVAPCRLWVKTDLEETVYGKAFGKAALKPFLDNQGIEVQFCNYAVTQSGRPRAELTDTLIARWRSMFTTPDVIFKPYCTGWPGSPATPAQ